MSSLFRNATAARAVVVGATTLAAVAASAGANAAQIFYQPVASLSAGYNTNVNLDPAVRQGAPSYVADLATNLGIATQRSETTLQPRLLYNYYPTIDERNRLEGFLNLVTRYSWERDRFTLNGFFDHRDDVNAELPTAVDNPINPGIGNTTPGTGQVKVGVVRNYTILDPTFTHLLTPLSSIGLATEYQRMDYSPSDTGAHADFQYYQGRLFYSKTLDIRSDFALGVFGNRFQSGSIDSHANSGGVQLNGGYNWTPVLRSDLVLQLQHTQFEETAPHMLDQRSNPWAASFNTTYKTQLSSYRLNIGRTLYPGSTGGLTRTDQIRGEYDHDFSQRLAFTAALRYFRQQTFVGATGNDTRNYGTATIHAQYMITRTLFVAGSYTYVWQRYFEAEAAQTSNFLLSVGYRGMERQRH